MLVSICTASVGLGPVSRILPRLFGRTMPPNIDQEPAGTLYLASISTLEGLVAETKSCSVKTTITTARTKNRLVPKL
jgi:hypothetical protein